MSTGISEIGSHPKDVERLKHHILWMRMVRAAGKGEWFITAFASVFKSPVREVYLR